MQTIEKIRESGATAVFLAVPPTVAGFSAGANKKLAVYAFLGTRAWDKDFWSLSKRIAVHIGYPAEQATNNETAMSQKLWKLPHKYGEDAGFLSRQLLPSTPIFWQLPPWIARCRRCVTRIRAKQRDRRRLREERKPGGSRVKPEFRAARRLRTRSTALTVFEKGFHQL